MISTEASTETIATRVRGAAIAWQTAQLEQSCDFAGGSSFESRSHCGATFAWCEQAQECFEVVAEA